MGRSGERHIPCHALVRAQPVREQDFRGFFHLRLGLVEHGADRYLAPPFREGKGKGLAGPVARDYQAHFLAAHGEERLVH